MKRNISGILLLDKPVGISSNGVLQVVKRFFRASKAGHTGSLDPKASGMLPICFGEATKFSQFLLESDKRYYVVGKLGETTKSGDSEGEIIEKRDVNVTLNAVKKILPKFTGKISQIPPMHSAIKHKGQPLYKLARQGVEVERKSREVEIYQLDMLSFENDHVEFEVHCSKGTYIRTLIADIGESLGCGAHVVELRRLSVGPYNGDMVSLDTLYELAEKSDYKKLDSFLLPIESTLRDIPEICLSSDMIYYMFSGQSLLIPSAPASGLVRLMSKDKRFVGVGEVTSDGMVAPKRMVKTQ